MNLKAFPRNGRWCFSAFSTFLTLLILEGASGADLDRSNTDDTFFSNTIVEKMEFFRQVENIPKLKPLSPKSEYPVIISTGASCRTGSGKLITFDRLNIAAKSVGPLQGIEDCLQLIDYLQDEEQHIKYLAVKAIVLHLRIELTRSKEFWILTDKSKEYYPKLYSEVVEKAITSMKALKTR